MQVCAGTCYSRQLATKVLSQQNKLTQEHAQSRILGQGSLAQTQHSFPTESTEEVNPNA